MQMSFVKNSTLTSDLEKEILFHLSELRYHEENYYQSLAEAHGHLEKFRYHDKEINQLNDEALHG
jgi:hypothetical protein